MGGAGGGIGCLIITVTENQSKLWSITLSGSEVLDQDSKEAVFFELAGKYNSLRTKKEKMVFLRELEEIVLPKLSMGKIHRKSLIRKLRLATIAGVAKSERRGRTPKYNDLDRYHLVLLWKLSGYPCSKRLKAILPEWLLKYDCPDSIKARLKSISPAQMDIFLKQARIDYQRKVNSGTIPAKNHIKKLIRLREPGFRYEEPGFIESDTVLHCGHYIWGTYGHTVSMTDLFCGWTAGGSEIIKIIEVPRRAPFLISRKL